MQVLCLLTALCQVAWDSNRILLYLSRGCLHATPTICVLNGLGAALHGCTRWHTQSAPSYCGRPAANEVQGRAEPEVARGHVSYDHKTFSVLSSTETAL